MLMGIFNLFRRSYLALQVVAVIVWLGLELAGYGFGLLDGLLQRRLTNAEAPRGIGGLLSRAPPGPVRLTRAERDALRSRLAATFGAAMPKTTTLAELRWMYEFASGSLCDWRGTNVAADPKECNRLKRTTPFFQALLESMHPTTETLMLEEITGHKGDKVLVAFFLGTDSKPKILFDLSRLDHGRWDASKGFKLKAYHGGGLSELTLGDPLNTEARLYRIDDPGVMKRRRPGCDQMHCTALLLLYGYDYQGYRNTEGVLTTNNLADIPVTPELERRFELYAALLGKTMPATGTVAPVPYKIERFGVTKFETLHLQRKLDTLLGAESASRVLYSPVAFDVAFGRMFGITLDGTLYALWDGGRGYASLGTDRMVFDVIEGGKRRRLDTVRSADGVYLLPFSCPGALEVRKTIAQDGAPWSSFGQFTDLFAPLRKAEH